MDCYKLFLFFCLFHLNIVDGAPADFEWEDERYFVRANKLYVKNNGRYVREPVGCLCPTATGLKESLFKKFEKTGFEKQCLKALDSSNKTIWYTKLGNGVCDIGKKQFFECGTWGVEMKVLGCCAKADNIYFPPSSVNKYRYESEPNVHNIVTCIRHVTDTYKLKIYPAKEGNGISKGDKILAGVTFANKPPTSPVEGRTRHDGDSSSSSSSDRTWET